MEPLYDPAWKFLVSGSVFTLSMLVGYFTVQGSVNAYARVIVACGWLTFIALMGTGEFWLMNAMALLWLWTFHLSYQEYWKKRGLQEDPNPLLKPPRLVKLIICGLILLGTFIACLAVCLRDEWSWSRFYTADHDQFLASVIFPMVFPWLYYLHLAAISPDRQGFKRWLWLTGAAVAGFIAIESSKELLGVFQPREPVLSAVTYTIFLATFLLVTHRSSGSYFLTFASLTIVGMTVAVVGVFAVQLTNARQQAFSASDQVQDIPSRIDDWNGEVLNIVNTWTRPLTAKDPASIERQLDQLESRDQEIANLPLADLYKHKLFQSNWQVAVNHLLGETLRYDNGFRIVDVYRQRYLAFNRLNRIRLASRQVLLDRGGLPSSLKELSGQVRMEIPLDPFTGLAFMEQTDEKSWAVYSIGEDQRDDNGAPVEVVGSSRIDDLAMDRWCGDIALQIKPDTQQ